MPQKTHNSLIRLKAHKVNIKLDWQKKALILLAVLILILSVVLTVFAIREAEREKLIKQREINQEQQRVVASIIDQVDENISEAEERIFSFFDPSKNQLDENRLTETAARIDKNELLVSEVFYVANSGKIIGIVPRKRLVVVDGEVTKSITVYDDA